MDGSGVLELDLNKQWPCVTWIMGLCVTRHNFEALLKESLWPCSLDVLWDFVQIGSKNPTQMFCFCSLSRLFFFVLLKYTALQKFGNALEKWGFGWYTLPSTLPSLTSSTLPSCANPIWRGNSQLASCLSWNGLPNHPTSTQLSY